MDGAILDKATLGRFMLAALAAPVAIVLAGCSAEPDAAASKAAQVALGAGIYERRCASCHGTNLEGQPKWRERLANGRLPAPPHDASGHTWHHPDQVLFDLIKQGVAAYAGAGYESDMPAYAGMLSDDEIRAVLAFIKSRWPAHIRDKQAQIDAAQRAK